MKIVYVVMSHKTDIEFFRCDYEHEADQWVSDMMKKTTMMEFYIRKVYAN